METRVDLVDQQSGLCSTCFCSLSDPDAGSKPNAANVTRKVPEGRCTVTTLTAISGVLCLLSVVACVVSLVTYHKIQTQSLSLSKQHSTSADQSGRETQGVFDSLRAFEGLPSDGDSDKLKEVSDALNHLISRLDSGQISPDLNKDRSIQINQSSSQLEGMADGGRSPLAGSDNGHPGPKMSVMYSSYMDDTFIKSEFGERRHASDFCKKILRWGGTACVNGTFYSDEVPLTLSVFRRISAVGDTDTDTADLFARREDGSFTVLRTGLYLLFAHVQFFSYEEQRLVIVHSSRIDNEMKSSLECRVSAGNGRHVTQHQNFRVCSLAEVVYMKARDKVRVMMFDKTIEMDLRKNSSYFGALYFQEA